MKACALCNGVSHYKENCPQCGRILMDYGRVYDYYDDYSAYMDIDSIQLADGIPRSSGDEECLHLFGCSNCLVEKPINIPFTTI